MNSTATLFGVIVMSFVLSAGGGAMQSESGASPASAGQATSAPQNNAKDEEEIRRVVTDSQFNETLLIYVDPVGFDKSLLTKYWVPESKGGQAIVQV